MCEKISLKKFENPKMKLPRIKFQKPILREGSEKDLF